MGNQPPGQAALSRFQIWYGTDVPPSPLRALHAGPVEAMLDGVDLRYVRSGGHMLALRIYAAVRDGNWGTLPVEFSGLEVDARADSFTVRFEARHREGEIDYLWHGLISGAPDGTIDYSMDGAAQRDFRYNKIGLNIHHPAPECAGQPYRGETDLGPIAGRLPYTVGPQVMIDGIDTPLFTPVRTLTIKLPDHGYVRFEFEGALAEMEDQRNWTDGSFKTYLPPQARGFPYQARSGQVFRQRIVLSPGVDVNVTPIAPGQIHLDIGAAIGVLPQIGLGMASHGQELSPREATLLRALRLDHVRVDLHLAQSDVPPELGRARRAAARLGCGLELAVFVDDDAPAQLEALALLLQSTDAPVRRVIVFHEREEATGRRWLELARGRLGPLLTAVPFVGGANANFCEVNRNRPVDGTMDAVSYAVNPQVHAFDDRSLSEALEGLAATVKTARSFFGDRPPVVSPVTLRPRFNAVATDADAPTTVAADTLPWQVDPRQMSLFGAAWTVGSLKYLAESGAGGVTYYETTGWRGVMETGSGPALPTVFPSWPGMIYPLYHVFADLADWQGGAVHACSTSAPLTLIGLAVQVAGRLHLMIANLAAQPQHARIAPLHAPEVSVRVLDEASFATATREPETFRSSVQTQRPIDGVLAIELQPYAVARIDM